MCTWEGNWASHEHGGCLQAHAVTHQAWRQGPVQGLAEQACENGVTPQHSQQACSGVLTAAQLGSTRLGVGSTFLRRKGETGQWFPGH